MLNLIYSLQAKFYTMSSIPRPRSMGLFVSICINKDLFDICSLGVGDKCIRFLQWALGVCQQTKESK